MSFSRIVIVGAALLCGLTHAWAQDAKMGLKIIAALGAAMNRNARWLVQDKHQPVAMEHAGEQAFWSEVF